jgi:hypothetical protein
MKAKWIAILAVMLMVFGVVACQKEADMPIGTQQGDATAPRGDQGSGGPEFTPVSEIRVPDVVKGKWASVIITLENKGTNEIKDITVGVNGQFTIPGTKIVLNVGDYLPDFKMEGPVITSSSNESLNPAVHIVVTEDGVEIFKGWLFAKWPAIHPFQHETYGLTLKDGVPAS